MAWYAVFSSHLQSHAAMQPFEKTCEQFKVESFLKGIDKNATAVA